MSSQASFADGRYAYVQETGYVTETEGFGWSFVFEPLASKETISLADDPEKGWRLVGSVLGK